MVPGAVGINISCFFLEGQHFGLQAKVTCQVVGAAADDTLLLFSTELNNKRPETHPGFTAIKGAANNDNILNPCNSSAALIVSLIYIS